MFYSDWKIRSRLLLGIAATGIVVVSITGLTVHTLLQKIAEDTLPELNSLHQLETSARDLVSEYNEFLLQPDEKSLDQIVSRESKITIALQEYAATSVFQAGRANAVDAIEASVKALHESGLLVIESQTALNQKLEALGQLEHDFRQLFDEAEAESHGTGSEVGLQAGSLGIDSLESKHDNFHTIRLMLTELYLEILKFDRSGGDETRQQIEETRAEISKLLEQLTASTSGFLVGTPIQSSVIRLGSEFIKMFGQILLLHEQLVDSRESLGQTAERLSGVIAEADAHTSEEAEKTLSNTITIILLLILSMPAVLGLSSWLTISAAIKPLLALSDSVKSIGTGELSTRVTIESKDEFGELAQSFNLMAKELQQNEQIQQKFVTQLEQKNTELERFTYTVSHDLKSPLVTVKGFLGLLERDIKTGDMERVDKDMLQIVAAADKMGNLLDDLLELSRVGRVVNQPESFSLSALVEDVLFLLQGAIQDSGAEIDVAVDMPAVFADRHRINEVMQNLLENAIKFSVVGEVAKISVSAETQNDRVLCRVADKGIGIDPRYQEKIFELFDRLEINIEGTGVGLALVKRIIEVHDGKIWVESDGDGQGSVFCFTLPCGGGENQ